MISPKYTDNILLFKNKIVNLGGNVAGQVFNVELDLTTKYGAVLFIQVGRETTVDISDEIQDEGLLISIRRLYSYSGNKLDHPAGHFFRMRNDIVIMQNVASGVIGNNVIALTTLPACLPGEYVYFRGSSDSSFTNFEIAKVLKVIGNNVTFDAPLFINHTGDVMFTHADVLTPLTIQGGAIWRITFDYGAAQLPDAIAVVRCMAQTYDADMEL
jgi:sporulation protein YlmC with PRC-barrel domain